jgi:hypothetical protein
MITPVLVLAAATAARASPKSATLTAPSRPSRTFSGLTSRWMMPARCAAARPFRTPSMMSSDSRTVSRPRARSTSRSVGPATYSMTM